jgi:hypothetical protein
VSIVTGAFATGQSRADQSTFNVRFGSFADIVAALPNVRFTPQSRHRSASSARPLSAIADIGTSFDHVVGAQQNRFRHHKTEAFSCVDIDSQAKFDRQLNG